MNKIRKFKKMVINELELPIQRNQKLKTTAYEIVLRYIFFLM